MISELHDEARLIADCKNDDVVATAHELAKQMKESRVLDEMAKPQKITGKNDCINMLIDTPGTAYAIIDV